jgi:hypothetical protein
MAAAIAQKNHRNSRNNRCLLTGRNGHILNTLSCPMADFHEGARNLFLAMCAKKIITKNR